MTDNRVKQFNFYHRQYPYTVEFEDEQEYKGMFYLPSWYPVESQKLAVQHSNLVVEAPADYQLRYKQYAFESAPAKKSDDGKQVLSWTLQNYKAVTSEPFQPGFAELLPNIRLAPSAFELQDYKGNMNSWFEFGKFLNQLYVGRDELPSHIKDSVQQVTAACKTDEEKVERLYAFMQRNTRYISIQLGIGGWQPFEASFVATKKYGDCKALSNYMKALLKEAGVRAHNVVINSGTGKKGLDEDFPSTQFNHMVLVVPLKSDSIWLECTSQTLCPRFMGSSTANRKALMMAEDGGYVVNTPVYQPKDNLQSRKVKAVIDGEGNLNAEVYTLFTGEQQEYAHAIMHSLNDEERKKLLNEELNLPTYDIKESRYSQQAGRIPVVDEYLAIKAPNYASVTGKRLFIQPNLFNKSTTKLSTEKQRRYPIEFRYAYRDVDSIEIRVPEGYTAEAIPKNVEMKNKFGNYSITFRAADNKIEMVRVVERATGQFPASEYGELVKYYDEIHKADRGRIVLVKKE